MKIIDWKLKYDSYPELQCKAPCSMYSVLYANGIIKDPFYRCNEQQAVKLSEKGCQFSAEFNIEQDMMSKKNVFVKFYGLDTLCSIYLNDKLLANTNNMHRTYIFDIKDIIKEGKNKMMLIFSSPIKYISEMNKKHKLFTNGDTMPGASHMRKALYMFGWDWGPTLPDMGIFRDVEIVAYDKAEIENVLILQQHLPDHVMLDINIETKGNTNDLVYRVLVDGKEYSSTENKFSVRIDNPKLWWPNGYGEQNLYDVNIELVYNNSVIDKMKKTIGLRTLTVSRDRDEYGEEFCFVVNNIKIFSMGADYVPEDSFLSRVTKERTENLIKDCVAANFNTIRIWGGGTYPNDYFYELCDRYGLIVWQDFMFACINVYLTKEYENTVICEVIDNIKRLRHHASLGLLCGNNEIEEGILYWKEAKGSELVKADYIKLFEHIIPDLCAEYAPQTFYWSSSPSSGGGVDNPTDENRGDMHCWAVWHGREPFEFYRTKYFRFLSEYGFESFPALKTIETFADKQDMNIFSEVMENHQKCKSGNEKILYYCADKYPYLTGFENIVYASQILQANAVKYAVEHLRRNRGRCMGSLYWQLNDCWPVASWASRDYFGRWKALHYYAKRFYAPVLLSLHETESSVVINISNEKLEQFDGIIKYGIYDTEFNCIYEDGIETSVNAISSDDVVCAKVGKYIEKREKEVFFAAKIYDKFGNKISEQNVMFAKPKRFEFKKPSIKIDIIEGAKDTTLQILSDCYTKDIAIEFSDQDIVFSDNYFDITSKEPVNITFECNCSKQKLLETIQIKTLNEVILNP